MNLKINKHKLFLLLLTVASIFGNKLPGITVPGIGFMFPIRIIAFLFPLYLLVTRTGDKKSYRYHPQYIYTLIMVVVFLLLGGLTILWSNTKSLFITGFLMYYTQFMTMLAGMVTIKDSEDADFVLKVMLLSSLVVGIMGLYESFTGNSVFEVTYEYYLTTYNSLGLTRPRSIFYNTNNYAFYFSTILCLIWSKYGNKKIPSLLLFAFCSFNVFLTDSRLGLLVILVVIAIDFLFFSEGKRRLGYLLLAGIVALIFGEYIFGSSLFSSNIQVADEDRWPIWNLAIDAAKNGAWMGGGFGSAFTQINASPHNLFLEWLLDCGILAVVVFLIWLVWVIVGFFRSKYNFGVMFVVAFILSTIGPSSLQGYYFLWLGFAIMLKNSYFISNNSTQSPGEEQYEKK